jgi:nucleotide-binding universal stress UspA family protein
MGFAQIKSDVSQGGKTMDKLKINKVLFPVDFSEVSPKIVPWVKGMADRFDTEIHLLYVVRRMDHLGGFYVEEISIRNFEKEILDGVGKSIREFAEEHFHEYTKLKTKFVVGDAPEEIVSYAEKEGIDLIIMGTHGRKGLDRLFFGSVAEKVIKTASVPVLSINPYRVPGL